MSTEHTPGPYTVQRWDYTHPTRYVWVIVANGKDAIAQTCTPYRTDGTGDQEEEANANQIAYALNALDSMKRPQMEGPKAAIAAAEGSDQ